MPRPEAIPGIINPADEMQSKWAEAEPNVRRYYALSFPTLASLADEDPESQPVWDAIDQIVANDRYEQFLDGCDGFVALKLALGL